MKFDRKQFWTSYRTAFGKVSQSQVNGLEFLLAAFEKDSAWADIRRIAYALATVKRECADTFEPIEEFGKGQGKPYGKAINGKVYYGRGFVQLTWLVNYASAAATTGFPLVARPELALDQTVAFQIMTRGMNEGWFTGKKLSDFINAQKCDYTNARRIINGLDHASEIAGYAGAFEKILNDSVSTDQTPGAPALPKASRNPSTDTVETAGNSAEKLSAEDSAGNSIKVKN